jgi:D-galactarolactone cycloisomerase
MTIFGGAAVKIRDVEVFQVQWAPEDKPAQRSAWVRVQCDDGPCGIGEASPMQGGLASLGIVKHNLAPTLIDKDPLDHAVLLDTLLHTFVKLGPEAPKPRLAGRDSANSARKALILLLF